MAELEFVHSVMGGHKTANLIMGVFGIEQTGLTPLVTKHEVDTKGGADQIVSRAGLSRPIDFLTTHDMDLRATVLDLREQVEEEGRKVHSLSIDEAQFLERSQVRQLFELAEMDGVPVKAFGLKSDYTTRLFPGSERLIEMAHTVTELQTVCAAGCGRIAVFNARLEDGEYVRQGAQVAIDGEAGVTYQALCGTDYAKNVGFPE